MPLYLHLANLIIDKRAVAAKYPGGIAGFRADHDIAEDNFHQEDLELFGLAAMNADELYGRMEELMGHGLVYDRIDPTQSELVIVTRYGGALWKPGWLHTNSLHAWHSDCAPAVQAKAVRLGRTTVDQLQAMRERGEDVFVAFVE